MLGIDVGGTFTDCVLVHGGELFRAKVATTPDQSEGVLAAAFRALAAAGVEAGQVDYFAHGMTTATNALLERQGARTAAVATEGFRDILEIGRQNRSRLYDLCPERPEPLVPRELRYTVVERVTPAGAERELTDREAERLVARLKDARPEAIAVCLLFSFLNPGHEERLGELLKRELPGVHVSLSSRVLPQFREYERFSTTAVDAYLTPVVQRYLASLGEGVRAAGLPEPAIMQSNGGVIPLPLAAASAAPLLLSGPAAGVVGAAFAGGRGGCGDLMAFDMGGTSTDVTLVRGGAATVTGSSEIGGSPVALPMVDIHTIGAGGGSIAWIDAGGALRVGPRSAGALPGPACYGNGGSEPTVTDANLVLGYLGGDLGGAGGIRLDADAAREVVGALAASLGLRLEEAAMGIRRVANAGMVKALRVISVERGHDPRGFVLVAFGGAGPMHGADLAGELEVSRVLVPDSCGVLSALGMVVGDQRRDWVRTVSAPPDWDTEFVASAFARLEEETGAGPAGARVVRQADLRYRGQSHELTVDYDGGGRDSLVAAFGAAHEQAYGYTAQDEAVELINIRVTALEALEGPELWPPRAGAGKPLFRRAYFGGEWLEAAVWQRLDLGLDTVPGPAVIEEGEATTVVPPGWEARLDDAGNLWLEAGKEWTL
ncbi:MAG: hydantoinase/oxoprolinase family protein [Gaiellales bacterium]|nr:MAG: hydantoinase/oxoprolinase family protein [Gaiellales bacterium]